MTTQPPLDRLSRRMQRAGLPAHYVERIVSELREHMHELAEDSNDTAAARSVIHHHDVDSLADQFIHIYRQARWYRRLPSIVWIAAAPVYAIVFCGLFYSILLVPCVSLHEMFAAGDPAQLLAAAPLFGLLYAGKFVTPSASAWLAHRFLRRLGKPRWVTACSLTTLALAFLLITTDATWTGLESGNSFSLGFETDQLEKHSHWPFIQSGIILAFSLAALRFDRREACQA